MSADAGRIDAGVFALACAHAGLNLRQVADACGLSRAAVQHWTIRGVPAPRAGQVIDLLGEDALRKARADAAAGVGRKDLRIDADVFEIARTRAGMSRSQVAEALGVAPGTVKSWATHGVAVSRIEEVIGLLGTGTLARAREDAAAGRTPDDLAIEGRVFAAARERAEKSLQQLADALETATSTIHNWSIRGVPPLRAGQVRTLLGEEAVRLIENTVAERTEGTGRRIDGAVLGSALTHAGMRPQALAEALGVPEHFVGSWLRRGVPMSRDSMVRGFFGETALRQAAADVLAHAC